MSISEMTEGGWITNLTVERLIEKLKEFDPKAYIVVWDGNEGLPLQISDIVIGEDEEGNTTNQIEIHTW